MRRAVRVGVTILVASLATEARSEPAVMAWPAAPSVDVTPAEQAIARRGLRPVSFDEIRKRWSTPAPVDPTASDGLERARAAYLAQRWDDMLAALAELERALFATGDCALLWEVELQLGLAYFSRKQDGDDARAEERFRLAFELDSQRRPERSLYGPQVAEAYALAVAEASRRAPSPATITAAPSDARIAIDCVPVIDRHKARSIRAGLHVVHVTAPGYAPRALLVTHGAGDPVLVELEPLPGDAAARIGPAWADATLRPSTATGRKAILDAAAVVGAEVVLFVDVELETGRASAQLLAPRGASPVVTRAQASDAAAAALAMLGSDGRIVAPEEGGRRERDRSLLTHWWFWTGVGVVVVGAVALAVALSSGDGEHTVEVGVW